MNSFIITSSINNDTVFVGYNKIMDSFEWVENQSQAHIFDNNEDYDRVVESGILTDKGLDSRPRIETM